MRRALIAALLTGALLLGAAATGGAQQSVTGQILTVEDGYVFFTSGNAYRTAPGMRVVDAKGAALTSTPTVGSAVTLTLDGSGQVAILTLSPAVQGKAAVELAAAALRGTLVPVTFVVLVPPSTGQQDQVYLTDSERNWDPLAIRMDRSDALHFRVTISVPTGATFRYLYTRGNSPTIERGTTGLQRAPRTLSLEDDKARTVEDTVQHWGDEVGNGVLPAPQATPTPYNPSPYVNLPTPTPAVQTNARARP
jgi:hypothetical protein